MALKSTYVDIRATCLVFKTTCVDRRISLREDAFFFTRMTLFLPLDKKNTRDKVRGLCVTSERPIEELGVRCLSTLNRGQESKAAVSSWCGCYFFYICSGVRNLH